MAALLLDDARKSSASFSQSSASMPESASLMLDLVRFAATIAVVVDHASLPNFGISAHNRQIWGFVAVPVFFVLSGFVIRHGTHTRQNTFPGYLADRASRIYSVVLPALAISAAVGGTCFLLNRDLFLRNWAGTFDHPLQRLAINLLFLSQAWGLDTTPFMNISFWSLGYECIYYVLFGCVYFLHGKVRLISVVCICAVIGPQVLLLFPIWLLGCGLYDVYMYVRQFYLARAIPVLTLILMIFATVLAFSAIPICSTLHYL